MYRRRPCPSFYYIGSAGASSPEHWSAAMVLLLSDKDDREDNSGCLIFFEYPEITSAASPEVRDLINAGILQALLRTTPANYSDARSLDESAKTFAEYCAQVHDSTKGTPADDPMFQRKTVEVFRSSAPVFSLQSVTNEDSGGSIHSGRSSSSTSMLRQGNPLSLPISCSQVRCPAYALSQNSNSEKTRLRARAVARPATPSHFPSHPFTRSHSSSRSR